MARHHNKVGQVGHILKDFFYNSTVKKVLKKSTYLAYLNLREEF